MDRRQYILALDQGTTSSRAIVFDRSGKAVSTVQKEFKQHYPQPGWVEHDPEEIWESQCMAAARAIEAAGLGAQDIAAIGITNQRETVVVWDKATGKPIHPAIVWQDRRTADLCGRLKEEGCSKVIRKKTGLLLDPYFSGTKIHWILENIGGIRERAERGEVLFGTIDSWLIWKLTGGKAHVTDVSNASRTLLFNIHSLEWDRELLGLLYIPEAMLPIVKSSSEIFGYTEEGPLPHGIPIAGVAGDQQAALFGQACFKKGMAKNTYGTGCFLLMNTGALPIQSQHKLLTTIAWRIGNRTEYALEGSVFIGGAVIQWLRDELQIISSAQECNELATTVKDSNGLFLVPAFTGLGAPHWDPQARGTAIGITRGTNRAHLCRAALESIGFQVADLVRAQMEDSGLPLAQLRVDGGASRSDPLLQFQADLLQSEVVRPKCVETTALGAAYLAGLAVGYWGDMGEIYNNWAEADHFQPNRSAEEIQPLLDSWNDAVSRSLGWKH
ncbi:glycerol kinase GlpK [Puniceicoccales bacterium CK1056]|uniref:Glycerol kinase n=1 Tax=Oceanipulchritudo coccoides TaxID=2706888 RepID=A0A6B2M308_9BACT|nr:glycerol kinase GlpK [Oceanipulchritudo coccoides]NDV63401.1 glycerol kinase GlpK [Oceanipulchritudo coccoides]